MKLYKFRQLGNCHDLERLEEIIEEGKFWCSKLWDLNDPMEGVYRNSTFNTKQSRELFIEKNNYLICSFSGKIGFNNPTLWGYYANGFKGIAIEIEIEKKDVYEIDYVERKDFEKNLDDAITIITRKYNDWEHENEYRFLIESNQNKQKIGENGEITKIYFGNPYGNLVNTSDIIKNSKSLKKYRRYKDKLIMFCDNIGIEHSLYNLHRRGKNK